MAANTASISDITWDMLSDAGLDTRKIERVPDGLGDWMYVVTEGDVQVRFGPVVDVDNNAPEDGDFGWDITSYSRGDQDWVMGASDWKQTAAGAIESVRHFLGRAA